MGFVTLQHYPGINDMAIARGLLDSEGIETFTTDRFVDTNPFLGGSFTPVNLQVPEEDYERASQILREHGLLHSKEQLSGAALKPLKQAGKKQGLYLTILVLFIILFIMLALSVVQPLH